MIEIDTLGREIQIFRGKLSEIPTLLPGQPACAYDDVTNQPSLWIGTESEGNKRIQAEQYIIDDLVSNEADAALSARQGKILKDLIDAIGSGGSSVNVVDNLMSSSPISALSARQGKVLNEKIIAHENNTGEDKHIELATQAPVDLTNTGVVFLRRDESAVTVPNQPTFDELKQEFNRLNVEFETHLIEKGQANGYATLDDNANVPLSQLGNIPIPYDSGWIKPSTSIFWAQTTPQYRKVQDSLYFRIFGTVDTSANPLICTLPIGFRPTIETPITTWDKANSVQVIIIVKPNGEVEFNRTPGTTPNSSLNIIGSGVLFID